MSTLAGPLFALEASKTLKKTIVYQRRVGKPTAYLYKKPYDIKSVAQLAFRGYMSSARSVWSNLSVDEKVAWNNFVRQYCTFP